LYYQNIFIFISQTNFGSSSSNYPFIISLEHTVEKSHNALLFYFI